MRARVALYRDPTVNPAAAAAGVRQLPAAGSDMADTGEGPGGWLGCWAGWVAAGPSFTRTCCVHLLCASLSCLPACPPAHLPAPVRLCCR